MDNILALKVSNNIKKLRTNKNISQENLAHNIDIDRKYASIIEKGKTKISVEVLNKVCVGLDISLSEFFIQIGE
tara:strand:- start:218 stop:439 length:222 start_codon:yes stop_codon:yes gene_type:complete